MEVDQKENQQSLQQPFLQEQQEKEQISINESPPRADEFNSIQQAKVEDVKIQEYEDERTKSMGNSNTSECIKNDKQSNTPFNKQNRRQYKSILKSKGAINSDSFLEPRLDASGNEIKSKAQGEKTTHGITFSQQICDVQIVESWKKYNTDKSSKSCCSCAIM